LNSLTKSPHLSASMTTMSGSRKTRDSTLVSANWLPMPPMRSCVRVAGGSRVGHRWKGHVDFLGLGSVVGGCVGRT
jgi:hypothetical protein